MNETYTRNVIEAALLAAGKSLQPVELAQLFEENGRPTLEEIRAALEALSGDYAGRGVEIKETAAGFRIQVRREFANEISRLWPERPAKYSRAMLETLALIAYRQPITRAEIEAVRGVAVNPNILKAMIERNWVRVVGHRDVPGRPELLGTTRDFLEYFGLHTLDDLPPLAEIKVLGDMNMQLELRGAQASVAVTGLLALEAAAGAPPDAERSEFEQQEPQPLELQPLPLEPAGTDVPAPESLTSDVLTRQAAGANEAASQAAASRAGASEAQDTTAAVESPWERVAKTDEASSGESVSEDSDESAQARTVDAEDDSGQDDSSDEDELSADGRGSRELVAAPPDFDD